MNKLLTFVLLLTVCFNSYSQSKKLLGEFEDYKSKFEIDDKNIVVSKVIENLNGEKDDLYIKVKSFFTHNYGDAKSVIQTDDKSSGVVIGKGYYKLKELTDLVGSSNILGAYHILRVDIKDGRIRVICSANKWDVISSGSKYKTPEVKDGYILNYVPFTKNRFIDNGKQTEAFIKLIDGMYMTMDELEKSLIEGSVKVENEEW